LELKELNEGKYALILDGNESDLSAAYDIQQRFEHSNALEDIVYISMNGIEDDKLYKDRFLIKNTKASIINHFLWENIWSEEDQMIELDIMIEKFFSKGKQFVIEEYEFTEKEPFYDYGDANK
jgi:hypothetical protein